MRFIHTIIDRLKIPQPETLIPHSYDCDTRTYRIDVERYYLDSLVTLSLRRVTQKSDGLWRDLLTVDQEPMFGNRAILLEIFRDVKRGNFPFSQYTVCLERRMRSEKTYSLGYQKIEAKEIAAAHYGGIYQQIPS